MSHHRTTLARTLHDVGLAAWFGGSLMGAAALNPAAGEARDGADRLRVADAAWGRWMPVAAAAIGAHLLGGAKLTTGNASRILGQRGVASTSAAKTALTAAAVGATAAAGLRGKRVMDLEVEAAAAGEHVEVEDATHPAEGTDEELADAQRSLRLLQWAIPALTAGLLALNAWMGEQQRPSQVVGGVLDRLTPDRLTPDR